MISKIKNLEYNDVVFGPQCTFLIYIYSVDYIAFDQRSIMDPVLCAIQAKPYGCSDSDTMQGAIIYGNVAKFVCSAPSCVGMIDVLIHCSDSIDHHCVCSS
jgi:hypothetical protein